MEELVIAGKVLTVILGAIVALLSLGTSFWGWDRFLPFCKRARDGLEAFYNVNKTLTVTDKSGNGVEVPSSYVVYGDPGFQELRQAIRLYRPTLRGVVLGIGMAESAKATNVDWGTGVIIPGTLGYVMQVTAPRDDRVSAERVPFLQSPNENRLIDGWVKEMLQKRIASITAAFVVAWTVIASIIVWQ